MPGFRVAVSTRRTRLRRAVVTVVADRKLVRRAVYKRGRGLYAETKTDVPVIYALYQAMFCFGEQHRLRRVPLLAARACDFTRSEFHSRVNLALKLGTIFALKYLKKCQFPRWVRSPGPGILSRQARQRALRRRFRRRLSPPPPLPPPLSVLGSECGRGYLGF